MRRLRVWLGVITLVCRAGEVAGQTQDTEMPAAVAVFNFAGAPNVEEGAAWRALLVPGADTYLIVINGDRPADRSFVETLRQALANDMPGLKARTRALKYVRSEYKPARRVRGTTLGTGAIIEIYAFHRSGTIELSHQETERPSRFTSDIVAFAKVASMIPSSTKIVQTTVPGRPLQTDTVDTVTPDPRLQMQAQGIVLTESRALVTINATPRTTAATTPTSTAKPTGKSQQSEQPESPNQQPGNATSVLQLVTGSSEHFFLSANAGAGDVHRTEYDSDTKSLVPATPSSFYLGANFAISDLSTENQTFLSTLWRGAYIGALVEASARPADRFALIAGFRENPLVKLRNVVSFETVAPYVGALWVKSDTLIDNRRERRYRLRPTLIWGVSVNVGKAVEWLAPKKENPDKSGTETPKG